MGDMNVADIFMFGIHTVKFIDLSCTRCHCCWDQTPKDYMPLTYRITSPAHYYDFAILL